MATQPDSDRSDHENGAPAQGVPPSATAPVTAEGPAGWDPDRQYVRLGKRRIPLPRSRMVRTAAGISFVLMGMVGFLPVVGFWMIPLGLLILSVDFAPVRRFRRRVTVWLQRRWNRANGTGRNGRGDNAAGARTNKSDSA